MEEEKNLSSLSWTISSELRNKQLLKASIGMSPILILGVFLMLFTFPSQTISGGFSVQSILLSIIGMIVAVILFVLAKLFFFKNRWSYELDESGVYFQLNSKKEQLHWDRFSNFVNYSAISSNSVAQSKSMVYEGDIFYLEAKTRPFFWFGKTFYVVRTLPENSVQVQTMLNRYLPMEVRTNKTDLGLIKYKYR